MIDSEHVINGDEVKDAIMKNGIRDEQDILIHTFESKCPKEDIKEFLSNNDGILICEAELFTGMEAESVLIFMAAGLGTNLRVNMMRASSKLTIVHLYISQYPDYIDFEGANVVTKFMSNKKQRIKLNPKFYGQFVKD